MSTSTQIVTGVDFAFLPVKDFDAALEFYGTTLGLPLSVRYEKVPGAEFERSASRFRRGPPPPAMSWASSPAAAGPAAERLGDQGRRAEHERDGGGQADDAWRGSAVDAGLVHDRVPLPARDQPAVHRHGEHAGD